MQQQKLSPHYIQCTSIEHSQGTTSMYSKPPKLCTRFCCAMPYFVYVEVDGGFIWIMQLYQVETLSALWSLCAGNSLVIGEFLTQRTVRRSFDVWLICAWTIGWVNNRGAGDLRRHRTHYDVTVMLKGCFTGIGAIVRLAMCRWNKTWRMCMREISGHITTLLQPCV